MPGKAAAQMEALRRGTVQIVPEDGFLLKLARALEEGRPLRVKYGADPSAPDIHLGHTVPLRKLRQFQDLGHTVVFIIGDFTALVGDPSGRSQTRKRLSREEVRVNSLTYQEQVFKILDRARTEVVYNSSWLSPLCFGDIVELAAKTTVARMLERDDFSKRYREGKPISVLEFLYPLMQGYDSVAVRADVEIGGTDQTFNLLLAREIQRDYGQEPQAILTLPLLEGVDGTQKMSKSLGNYIGISEPASEIFGKVMSIPDDLMWRYYELLSAEDSDRVAEFKRRCAAGENPMAFKKLLGRELAGRFWSDVQASEAEAAFARVHQDRLNPEDPLELVIAPDEAASGVGILDLLGRAGMTASNSEGRRKVLEGAVSLNGEKIADPAVRLHPREGDILQLGRRRFARLALGLPRPVGK